MKKSSYYEGPTPEEMHEPIIKHFSQGNMPESDYDTSMFHHEDDIQYSSEEMYEPMKHFQDD